MKRIHILKEKNGNAYYYKSILPSKFSSKDKEPYFLDGVDGWKDKDLIYMPDKLDFHTLPKYKLVAESLSDLDVLYNDMVKENMAIIMDVAGDAMTFSHTELSLKLWMEAKIADKFKKSISDGFLQLSRNKEAYRIISLDHAKANEYLAMVKPEIETYTGQVLCDFFYYDVSIGYFVIVKKDKHKYKTKQLTAKISNSIKRDGQIRYITDLVDCAVSNKEYINTLENGMSNSQFLAGGKGYFQSVDNFNYLVKVNNYGLKRK